MNIIKNIPLHKKREEESSSDICKKNDTVEVKKSVLFNLLISKSENDTLFRKKIFFSFIMGIFVLGVVTILYFHARFKLDYYEANLLNALEKPAMEERGEYPQFFSSKCLIIENRYDRMA